MDYAKQYGQLHKKPMNFLGRTMLTYRDEIGDLIRRTKSKTILDYGCGKGEQYSVHQAHVAWGVPLPTLYDVGVRGFRDRPAGRYHGVICTDVMEHIEEDDATRILYDVVRFADRFVFFSICCRPGSKLLPDGRNVHLTLWSEKKWQRAIDSTPRRPGVVIEVRFTP